MPRLDPVGPSETDTAKADVRDFWEAVPCGAKHATAQEGSPEYFGQVEARRDELEPFIADHADFAGAAGKRVLEIGVGLGTDFVRFGRGGAVLTGVDLTEHAVALVRRRLEMEGLAGEVRVADAEDLPFEDGSFDIVYSWGVLHHTPHPDRAMAEATRVLRPGGRLCVMVYSRWSWVALGLWARYALLRGRPHHGLARVVSSHMESAGTRAYTMRELRRRFSDLEDLRLEKVATPYDRRVAGPLARPTGRLLGWFLVVHGRRPL